MANEHERPHKRFGLLGRNIHYSFSRGYFTKKFEALHLQNYSYQNFDLEHLELLDQTITQHEDLVGMNVTIPYKEEVLPFLDELDPLAERIGAVNTIAFGKDGRRIGYNTDYYGFKESLIPLLTEHHGRALILGTGGASKAVMAALEDLNISFFRVSRTPDKQQLSYDDLALNPSIFKDHPLLINCTPLGTYPNIEEAPTLPYDQIDNTFLLYDLIYNPSETRFLKLGKAQGAQTLNGLRMLELQAEKSWEIWTQ